MPYEELYFVKWYAKLRCVLVIEVDINVDIMGPRLLLHPLL
ncbi:MAG: hypothetical protein ABSB26_05220 [Nitrososphaerales archaeon]|jgi:hypothetical protein